MSFRDDDRILELTESIPIRKRRAILSHGGWGFVLLLWVSPAKERDD